MLDIIMLYVFLVVLSVIVMFTIMLQNINMIDECKNHYNYLTSDCMLSNITRSGFGNYLGIICTLTIIPVIFFLMFFIMDYLKMKTYYKNPQVFNLNKYLDNLLDINEVDLTLIKSFNK